MNKYNAFYAIGNSPRFLTVYADTLEQAVIFANKILVNNGDFKKVNRRGISVQLANY